MLSDLLFSLGIVLPLFMVIVLGYGLKRINFISDAFAANGNKMMFYIGLPVIVFRSIYRADIRELFDPGFVIAMTVITVVTAVAIWIFATPLIKDKPVRGAFVLSSFRGNQAFLGIPLMMNLAGDAGVIRVTMVVTFVLPIANILSVLLLASTCSKDKKVTVGGVLLTIIKNPIVITAAIGLGLVLPGIKLPMVADVTLDYIADMATPLALICIGASMKFTGFDKKFKYAVIGSFVKIVALPIAFALIGYLFGFRGYDLAAMTILGGVPSAIAGYSMVVEMGGDGYVASTIVLISTMLSAFTLTLIIYVIRVFHIVG
jgi:hypothetical protein